MALAALGVNILVGYCGQISLGSGAFMAVGAYGAYNLFVRVPGMPLLPAVIGGGLCAMVFGMVFGLPSLRVRGLYLAVATLASSLLLYAAAFQFPDGIQAQAAGALRGLKDTRMPMLLVALAYWGVGMPLGTGLAFGLGWGPHGMWAGMIGGLAVAAVLLGARFLRSSRRPQVVGPFAPEKS